MKNTRKNDLSDRLGASAQAKTALLQAHQAAKDAAEPTRAARQAERLAIAAARDERREERERLKTAEQERLEAADRKAAIDAAAAAEDEARRLAKENMISRVIEDEAARKAERDRRYANRKARQA